MRESRLQEKVGDSKFLGSKDLGILLLPQSKQKIYFLNRKENYFSSKMPVSNILKGMNSPAWPTL